MQNIQMFLQTIASTNFKLYVDYFTNLVTLEVLLKLMVLYFFIVWISIIVWVYKDITNRTYSSLYQILSLLLVLIFTPLWVFIYLLIRPTRTTTERYYETMEENFNLLSDAVSQTTIPCPSCKEEINSHYSYCPHCDFSLYSACEWCMKPVYFDWNSCPHCWRKVKKKTEEKWEEDEKEKTEEVKEWGKKAKKHDKDSKKDSDEKEKEEIDK